MRAYYVPADMELCPVHNLIYSLPLCDISVDKRIHKWETKAQKRQVTCPRCHDRFTVKLTSDPGALTPELSAQWASLSIKPQPGLRDVMEKASCHQTPTLPVGAHGHPSHRLPFPASLAARCSQVTPFCSVGYEGNFQVWLPSPLKRFCQQERAEGEEPAWAMQTRQHAILENVELQGSRSWGPDTVRPPHQP